ncbi:sugar-binding transcriptional regulator [Salinisphaera sp. Q1T1-3]|uniref:sugar-binding transcriptional regulator n=1 Tax=Salinisphaera sp. Q1T1-3 TaxID=2321229 RepID=UPI0013140C33|nr:sugar-binding transcriptional regulator [Salinisphaera sp. Q1T1-3]
MTIAQDSRDLSIYVAWLSYVGGYTQAEIATRLSLSRAKVHRLIGEAHKAGYVHVFIDRSPQQLVDQEDRLARRFSLTQCTVVPDVEDEAERGGNLAALGAASARYVHGRLASGEVTSLGVSWGRSLAEMTRRMPREQRTDLSVVSLMGSLTQQAAINPFDVVYRLAEITGGQGFFLPVPFIADTVADRDVLNAQRIVGEALERARSVDLAVVGIAAMRADQPIFRAERGLLGADELADLKAAGVVAELVGHFLDRTGRLVDIDMNRRTIGVSFAELAGLEVVAVVGGADKAEAIRAVLASGVIDRLIIDECAARALEALPTLVE